MITAGDGQTSGFGAISSERYPVLVATNSAVNVPTSCEKCLFLAATNKAGNSPVFPLQHVFHCQKHSWKCPMSTSAPYTKSTVQRSIW